VDEFGVKLLTFLGIGGFHVHRRSFICNLGNMRTYRRRVAVCGHFLISAANSLSDGTSPLPAALVSRAIRCVLRREGRQRAEARLAMLQRPLKSRPSCRDTLLPQSASIDRYLRAPRARTDVECSDIEN
jgi:hypothetical protein